MNHRQRGKCLIFYYSNFDPKRNLMGREFAEAERAEIGGAFASLGFEVESHRDVTKEAMMNIFARARTEDHSERDALVVVFVGYGVTCDRRRSLRLFTFDASVDSSDLWREFTGTKCLSLAGKPKLFFIQASPGKRTDGKLIGGTRSHKLGLRVTTDSCPESYVLPAHSDILIMSASFPGCDAVASRSNDSKGGMFIRSLSKVLQEKGSKENLLSLLLEVTRKVASELKSEGSAALKTGLKIPRTESTLLRHLYFTPKAN